jgi:hypothetical protein
MVGCGVLYRGVKVTRMTRLGVRRGGWCLEGAGTQAAMHTKLLTFDLTFV